MINAVSLAKEKDCPASVLTKSGEVDLPHQILLIMLKKNFLAIKKEVTKIGFVFAPSMHLLTSWSTIPPCL